jgi:hypothetical protein
MMPGLKCWQNILISDHALSDFTKASMIQTQVKGTVGNYEAAYAVANVAGGAVTQSWIQPDTSGSAAGCEG